MKSTKVSVRLDEFHAFLLDSIPYLLRRSHLSDSDVIRFALDYTFSNLAAIIDESKDDYVKQENIDACLRSRYLLGHRDSDLELLARFPTMGGVQIRSLDSE